MTGIDLGLRREFEKFLEGFFNVRRTRVRQVSATDTLMEKGITGKENVVFGRVERNTARSVARSVDDGEVRERGRKGVLRGKKDVWGRNRSSRLFSPVKSVLRGLLIETKILGMES